LVRQTLLRAPLFPDPSADQGVHVLRSSIRICGDILDAVSEGYRVNLPLRVLEGAASVSALVRSDRPAIVVESVKLAEDRSGDLVVRLYEARGTQVTGTVGFGFDVRGIVETDLLERPLDQPTALVGATRAEARIRLRPFQIATLRVSHDQTSLA